MDLYNMALVLVYPDGYVDFFPIREGWWCHAYYLREYFKTSQIFQKIIEENDFHFDWENEVNIYPIWLLFALNNVIAIYNINLALVEKKMDRTEELSHFILALPEDYKHHLGLNKAKEAISKLDYKLYEIEKYLSYWDDFQEFDTEEYEAFFENKNEIEEKEKEKQL